MDTSRLPSGSQARVLKTLEKCGVERIPKRGKGSHIHVQLNGKPSTVQAGQISKGMVRTILKQLDLDAEVFIDAW